MRLCSCFGMIPAAILINYVALMQQQHPKLEIPFSFASLTKSSLEQPKKLFRAAIARTSWKSLDCKIAMLEGKQFQGQPLATKPNEEIALQVAASKSSQSSVALNVGLASDCVRGTQYPSRV